MSKYIDAERLRKEIERRITDNTFSETCKENADSFTDTSASTMIPSCWETEQKLVQTEDEREYVRTLKSLIADFLRGKEEVDRSYYQKIYDWLDGRHIEQKPELVKHPPISYAYSSTDSIDERIKKALLALLNSDLIKVAGSTFTKQDLIGWVERQNPVEWSEDKEQLLGFIFDLLESLEWRKEWAMGKKECLERIKSLRPQKKEDK